MSVITNAPHEHEGRGGGKPRPRLWKRVAAIVCAAGEQRGGMLTAMSAHAVACADRQIAEPHRKDRSLLDDASEGHEDD